MDTISKIDTKTSSEATVPPGYRVFTALAMIFCATLLVSNTIAVKIIHIYGFDLPAGIICFPVAYIFGDVLVEVYGYARTRRVIWYGFGCLALMSVFYYLAVLLPPAVFWKQQESFANLFGLAPRIALSSFVAYLVGSFLNAIVMSKMKLMTSGKFLWTRTIGSTIIGEGADSLVFNLCAFSFVFEMRQVIYIAFSGFVLKTLYEIVATPLTYIACAWLKRVETKDTFDHGVSYNPFKMRES